MASKVEFSSRSFSDDNSEAFRQFWTNQDFLDVTLVTMDEHHISAHRLVLSSFSPFFRSIFVKNQQTCPLLYLRGVKLKELRLILEYIYLGKCEVDSDEVEIFINVANDLQIKGLGSQGETEIIKTEDEHTNSADSIQDTSETTTKKIEHFIEEANCFTDVNGRKSDISFPIIEEEQESESIFTDNVNEEKEISNKQVSEQPCFKCHKCNKNFEKRKKYLSHLHHHKVAENYFEFFQCEQCDYKANSKLKLKDHINVNHKGILFECDKMLPSELGQDLAKCDYKCKSRTVLWKHNSSKHEGVSYSCDKCSYIAARKDQLGEHIKIKHDFVPYPCKYKLCDFSSNKKSLIKSHERVTHEGGWICNKCDKTFNNKRKYSVHISRAHKINKTVFKCVKCEFQTYPRARLMDHIQVEHEGVWFDCEQCEYKSKTRIAMWKHKRSKHDGVKYQCSLCDLKLGRKETLKEHMRRKHGN